jgi:glutamyl-tRNA(Gln) amidotransferase subunit D
MQPGDRVQLQTTKGAFSGILIQRPPLLDPKVLVLKLDTGYNMGIDISTIQSSSVLTPYTPKAQSHKPITHNPALPTVALLSFGGTISSRVDYQTGGVVANYGADDFYAMMPELAHIANIKTKQVLSVMSEDMDSTHWLRIVEEVTPFLQDPSISGVVLTQGTDTMHYSSAATSFLLGNLNKPVIFTAAQRSIDRGSSDAYMNLLCAIQSAIHFDGALVATCMHATTHDDYCYLIRGTKVRKMHTSRRDAFRPINEEPLAKVDTRGHIEICNHQYPKRSNQVVKPYTLFEQQIGIVYIYPGISPKVIEFHKNYKGLILACTALGHVPEQLLEPLAKLSIPVFVTSQTIYGRVHPNVYARLREMSVKIGLVFLEDMLVETAYAKLGWVLANFPSQVKEKMQENCAGEIAAEIPPTCFLR